MEHLLENLNTLREETIKKYYVAATTELSDKIKQEPLRTQFIIYSGCVSLDIAKEICKRLCSEGLTVSVVGNGVIFNTGYYLDITIPLPEHLTIEENTEVLQSEEEINHEAVKELFENLKVVNDNIQN